MLVNDHSSLELERRRLAAVAALELLDTEPESAFDALSAELAETLDAPMAAVSLIDRDRHWCKSMFGFDLAETPRSISICDHTIRSDAPLLIDDASEDARFERNELVTGPAHVRSYAGAPLTTQEGLRVGTICAMDRRPRHWSDREIGSLRRLAEIAIRLIESRAATLRCERLQAELAKLSESEFRYRGVFETMQEGVVLQNETGRILEVNPRGSEILGLTQAEVVGRGPTDERWRLRRVDGSEMPIDEQPSMRCLKTRAPVAPVLFSVGRPDGTRRWVSANATPMFAQGVADPYLTLTTFSDVTEQVETQAALHEAQKHEAIGRLTAGIAHDFNNLLQVIASAAGALRSARSASEAATLAQLIADSAARGSSLALSLLSYSRRQVLSPTSVDLNQAAADALGCTERLCGSSISLRLSLAATAPFAFVDQAQLNVALLNLTINAMDAMPNGGVITIETETRGGEGVIAVADEGAGIPRLLLDRIFDPYFTTKPSSRGTGLGLSMVKGFVEQSGGRIEVESEEGRGTRFLMRFPLAPSQASTPLASAPPQRDVGAGKRILLVEDDALLREALGISLSIAGFEVTTAIDGEAGLRALETEGPIDVLLTDAVMSAGLTGVELATEAHRRHPGLRVAVMSGYAENKISSEDSRSFAFLQKPFSIAAFMDATGLRSNA